MRSRISDLNLFRDVLGRRPRRIVILTSRLGSGHARAGEAIEHALLERDPSTRIQQMDFWSLMDRGVARAVKEAYLELVTRHPDLYDSLYGHDRHALLQLLVAGGIPEPVKEVILGLRSRPAMERVRGLYAQRGLLDRSLFTFLRASLAVTRDFCASKVLRQELLRWIPVLLARRLRSEVLRFSPDVIVATQMHPAALLSACRNRRSVGLGALVAVLTDYGVHDLWVQPRTDHYCVPTDEAAEDLLRRGILAHRVHLTGMPLMPGFRRLPSCTQARQELGLDPGRPTVLVAGGGLGLGLHKMVEDLVRNEPTWQFLVVAGRNSMALELLAPLAAEAPTRVRLFGWMDRMEILLRAADVVVAKPGGLTLAEALACGRPMVATGSLGGQEGFNARFLKHYGVGDLVPERELMESLRSLLGDFRKLASLQDRAWHLGRSDSAERVANLVYKLARNEPRNRQ